MTAHVQQTFTFPLARWAPTQPATIDPTLDLCSRYPLRMGGQRQCEIRSLPDTSTHDQHWESNPRPSDLERPYPLGTCSQHYRKHNLFAMEVIISSALLCSSQALTTNSQEPCQTLTRALREGRSQTRQFITSILPRCMIWRVSHPVMLLPTKYPQTTNRHIPSTQRAKTATKGESDPDHYQNLITSSFYHLGPLYKLSL